MLADTNLTHTHQHMYTTIAPAIAGNRYFLWMETIARWTVHKIVTYSQVAKILRTVLYFRLNLMQLIFAFKTV